MRNQTAVGLFLIAIGGLLFAYWVLIPAKEKQKILSEIYNTTNYSSPSYPRKLVPEMQIGHIHLKNKGSTVVLTQNYSLGRRITLDEKIYQGFKLSTNLFSGTKSYTLIFPGCVQCDGVSIVINNTCSNCDVDILLNDQQIFSGRPQNNFSHYIPQELLKEKNVLKFVLKPPKNPFVESSFNVKSVTLKYLQKEEFIGDFYYYGGDVYLDYNFCPVSPQAVQFYVNGHRVYFPSCSSNFYGSKMYLTPYLKQGYNQIKVSSKVPTKISLTLVYSSPKFFYFFKKPKYGIIYLFVVDGSGTLKINNCTFPITPQTTLIDASKCLMQYNEMVIEAKPYLDINRIIIT